jgi:Glycosyl hydrolase family 45
MINPPNTSDTVQNACTNSGDVSFICPRFMLFSGEMIQAAADDAKANNWPAGSFNYGVATLNGAACCACYQIVYDNPDNPPNPADSYSPPKPLVIQNFNTGGANNAFDVFMGKGGEGAFTNGCSQLYTDYPSIGEPYGGGITVETISACGTSSSTVASAACVSAVTGDCDQIKASSAYVTTTTQSSCIETNSAGSLYHINWNVKAQQVECPTALTEVTGCKPNPSNLPAPNPAVQTAAEASSWSNYSTTTMQDCCKPSCAWPGNVQNTQAPWSAMYQCDGSGNPMTN